MNEAAFRDLEGVYAGLADELERLSPVCRQSGECCRFAKSGHELWTTPLEYEYLRSRTGFAGALPGLIGRGTCPFLKDGKCGVRDHRMLGCRIYYCDPGFQPRMAGVYEKYHARVKQVMRDHRLEYGYFRYLDRIGADLGEGAAGSDSAEPRTV